MKDNNKLVITAVIILSVLVIVSLGLTLYFWQDNVKLRAKQNAQEEAAETTDSTENEKTVSVSEPKEIVSDFMNYTLGTLPTAKLDIAAGRKLMTATLSNKYPDNDFLVSRLYGIQDGPTSVSYVSQNVSGDSATVRYDASWGSTSLAWSFILEKQEDGNWLIDEFRNDAQ